LNEGWFIARAFGESHSSQRRDEWGTQYHDHACSLADGVLGHAGLAAVGGFAEPDACGAILGVGLEFVRDVRRGCVHDVAAVELDRAGAVGAAKFGVRVGDGFDDRLELPEGFIAATQFDAAPLGLALIDLFGFDGHGKTPS
jgi:hypothetical protein